MNKIISLILALCCCMCMTVPAFAAEIATSGGTGSTPVSLSTTDDGTLGGNPLLPLCVLPFPLHFPWQ